MEERSLVRQLLEPEEEKGPTPGERRGFGRVPWRWPDLLVVSALALLISVALTPLGVPTFGPTPGDASVAFFLQVLFSYTLLVGVVWLVGVRRHHASWETVGFRPLDIRSLVGLLGFLAAVIVGANVLMTVVGNVPRPPDIFVFGQAPGDVVLMGLLVLVAAPVAEEVFFRGFLLQGLARYLTFWPAAILTSAVFAAAHVWWQFYLPIFVLGLAFSWLFCRTGSLWAAIAAHTTINGTSFLVVLLLGT